MVTAMSFGVPLPESESEFPSYPPTPPSPSPKPAPSPLNPRPTYVRCESDGTRAVGGPRKGPAPVQMLCGCTLSLNPKPETRNPKPETRNPKP
ncbi:hypothetical protein T484DRAFT_2455139 [Baffinella frigidus]|nr:hypothetical protein T484DRAFT_2455139 [Cryptophyta sp. CCMP2293]